MRIAICDDEERFQLQLKDLIEHTYKSIDVLVDVFADGHKLLERFDATPYEVVFLDIEMPAMDGITLAKKIRERSESTFIVFLTSHVEYALEGYEVNALRYLTKPVREDKLREVLKYVMDKSVSKRQLMIRTDGEDLRLDLREVLYLEAQNQYVSVHATSGEYVVRANISDFEAELKNDGFFRIHRGYLVSLSRIRKIQKSDVCLDNGETLPVSRSNLKALKEALYSYVESEAF